MSVNSVNNDVHIAVSSLADHQAKVKEAKGAAAGTAANVKEAKGAAATAVKNNEEAQKVSAAAAQALAETDRATRALIKHKEKELKDARSNVEALVTELAKLTRPYTHRQCGNRCTRVQCVVSSTLFAGVAALAVLYGINKAKEFVDLN